jgi:hypothetical protein
MSATILSTLSNLVTGIKFETFSDIPSLQLWLDAFDENTIQKNAFFEDESWYFNENSRIECQNSGFSFGTNPFTVECWICPTGMSTDGNGTILMMSNFIFTYDFSGRIEKYFGFSSPINTITFNTWQHVAFVREGIGTNQSKIYVNGNLVCQGTMNDNIVSTSIPTIGMNNNGTFNGVIGYISNFRVVNGRALYTSNFNHLISAAVPLQNITDAGVNTPILTLQDVIVKDNSSNNLVLFNNGTLPAVVKLSSDMVVSNWLDKSPNALTASQLLVANRPTSLSAEINNLNILNFDYINKQHLNLSSPIALSSNFTHFFVYRRDTTNPISLSLGNKSTGVQSSFRHHSDNLIYSGAERTNTTIVSATTLIGGVRKNEYLQIDSTPIPFVTNWSSVQTTVNTIGVYNNVDYHRGPISEIIHTECMLPNYEINLINQRLFNKWKVAKVIPRIKTNPIITTGTSTSAVSSTLGTWYVEPTSFRIEWQRSLDSVDFTTITNTLSTYTNRFAISVYNPTPADYGYILRTSVSATNSIGTGVS